MSCLILTTSFIGYIGLCASLFSTDLTQSWDPQVVKLSDLGLLSSFIAIAFGRTCRCRRSSEKTSIPSERLPHITGFVYLCLRIGCPMVPHKPLVASSFCILNQHFGGYVPHIHSRPHGKSCFANQLKMQCRDANSVSHCQREVLGASTQEIAVVFSQYHPRVAVCHASVQIGSPPRKKHGSS